MKGLLFWFRLQFQRSCTPGVRKYSLKLGLKPLNIICGNRRVMPRSRGGKNAAYVLFESTQRLCGRYCGAVEGSKGRAGTIVCSALQPIQTEKRRHMFLDV